MFPAFSPLYSCRSLTDTFELPEGKMTALSVFSSASPLKAKLTVERELRNRLPISSGLYTSLAFMTVSDISTHRPLASWEPLLRVTRMSCNTFAVTWLSFQISRSLLWIDTVDLLFNQRSVKVIRYKVNTLISVERLCFSLSRVSINLSKESVSKTHLTSTHNFFNFESP